MAQGVVQGLPGGGKEKGFINAALNIRPKNFNKHSKYIFNVTPESAQKGERGSTWINSL